MKYDLYFLALPLSTFPYSDRKIPKRRRLVLFQVSESQRRGEFGIFQISNPMWAGGPRNSPSPRACIYGMYIGESPEFFQNPQGLCIEKSSWFPPRSFGITLRMITSRKQTACHPKGEFAANTKLHDDQKSIQNYVKSICEEEILLLSPHHKMLCKISVIFVIILIAMTSLLIT